MEIILERHKNRKLKDLTGQHKGRLFVIKRIGHDPEKNNYLWLCQCACGAECVRDTTALCSIKSCGCGRRLTHEGNPKWKGCGKLSQSFFNDIRKGAVSRNISFDITIEEAWEVFVEQDGKCVLTGEELIFPPTTNRHTRSANLTASLDRIDSTKGYTKDNIQWVHKVINIMKNRLSDEQFIDWCEKVVNHKNKDIH